MIRHLSLYYSDAKQEIIRLQDGYNIGRLHKLVVYIYIYISGKPTGKRPLGRPRRRWEDNIRMDLEEIEIGRAHV